MLTHYDIQFPIPKFHFTVFPMFMSSFQIPFASLHDHRFTNVPIQTISQLMAQYCSKVPYTSRYPSPQLSQDKTSLFPKRAFAVDAQIRRSALDVRKAQRHCNF